MSNDEAVIALCVICCIVFIILVVYVFKLYADTLKEKKEFNKRQSIFYKNELDSLKESYTTFYKNELDSLKNSYIEIQNDFNGKLEERTKQSILYQLELAKLKKSYLKTKKSILKDFSSELKNNPNFIDSSVFSTFMADYYTDRIGHLEKDILLSDNSKGKENETFVDDETKEECRKTIIYLKNLQYHLAFFLATHPEYKNDFKDYNNEKVLEFTEKEELRLKWFQQKENQLIASQKKMLSEISSNLTAIPYMSSIMADYETASLEDIAKKLDWGMSQERLKKVASIREIRSAAKQIAEKNLEAKYQLSYLLEMFPNLEDVLNTDYNDLPNIEVKDISDYDKSRDWLSKEEYQNLNSVERNQLALDRYMQSHNKTKWQIGRDYELYVGYKYTLKGYSVNYFGSYMGLEDLGRDLIVEKDGKVIIIQCKYWSREKLIHEKHINQLYGTVASYCIENKMKKSDVSGLLITNTQLSDMAKKMAAFLKISYIENYEKGTFPCIKCNIGHDENGETKIYHLPFDQQYDSTKIEGEGEFYAMTVKEAEDAGFRRAFKWFGNKNPV